MKQKAVVSKKSAAQQIAENKAFEIACQIDCIRQHTAKLLGQLQAGFEERETMIESLLWYFVAINEIEEQNNRSTTEEEPY